MTELVDDLRAAKRFNPKLARATREAVGASQEGIARELGVHRVSVARWELGLRRPRGALLHRYLALLERLRQEVDA